MTPASICRGILPAAALLFGLGCEAVAPLQPLPDKDSGTDAAMADEVGREDGAEAGQLDTAPRLDGNDMSDAAPKSDVATTADIRPDSADGGTPDDVPKADGGEGDASDATSDASDDTSDDGGVVDAATSDDGGVVDAAQESSDVGEVGGSTDGGIDGQAPDGRDGADGTVVTCNPWARFKKPLAVYGLNRQRGKEFRIHVSPDELTAYVSSGEWWGAADIYTATRGSRMDPFGALVPVTSINSDGAEDSVSLTGNGLTIVLDSNRTGSGWIYAATRQSISDPFPSPTRVTLTKDANDELDPYVLPDGSAVYFIADLPDHSGIYRAALNGTTPGELTPIFTAGERLPVVTQDELTIYFDGGGDIWMATRASRDRPFEEPINLDELNGDTTYEYPQSISPDGCRLYFSQILLPGDETFSMVAERAGP